MSQAKNRKKWNDILHLLKRGVRHLFLHNGWFKLMAVLISIILWAGLISQDPNVTRNKTFQNVEISIDTAKLKKGLIITSNLDEIRKGITVTSSVPQLQYENAEASVYDLHVDLSGIKTAGEYELKILSSEDATYGNVVSISPSTVKVRVEETYTLTGVPITVETKGKESVPDGWYITQPTTLLETVSVSGPASVVKEVTSAVVTVDLSALKWEEKNIRQYYEIQLYNQNSEEINNPLLTISSEGSNNDRALIEASIMPTRDFSLREMIRIQGEPAEGFEVVGEPNVNPEYITIAGSEEKLVELEELPVEQRAAKILETGIVDITDQSNTIVEEVKVKTLTISRDKVRIIRPDAGGVMVTVEISPTAEDNPDEEVNPEENQADDEAEKEETAPEGTEPITEQP